MNENGVILVFFRYSATSPHRTNKPSRDWLWVVVRKPRLVLFKLVAARNYATAKTRTKDRRPGFRPGVSVGRRRFEIIGFNFMAMGLHVEKSKRANK